MLAPALGADGLAHLKQRMIELSNTPVRKPADSERQIIGYGSSRSLYADEMAKRRRESTVRLALMKIADQQGDVDAFIDQYDKETQKVPRIAAYIAQPLLAAGRSDEAWQRLKDTEQRDDHRFADFEWIDTRIAVLKAMDRRDEAQTERWVCFTRWLSMPHLRAYLKNLPADADDFEAEEKALDVACNHTSFLTTLDFLVSWRDLDRAAGLVLQRADELDGSAYYILSPAAEALAGRHPLATTLLLRSIIDFALSKARTTRYKHAARHLHECGVPATGIEDYGVFETHAAYEAGLLRAHGKKTSFWRNIA